MATQRERTRVDLEAQAVALAEQLGHLAGTLQRTAAEMLERLGRGAGAPAGGRTKARGKSGKPGAGPRRSGSPAHAPGKRRRKPAPSVRGAKKSDLAIPKMRTAKVVRQRRKTHF